MAKKKTAGDADSNEPAQSPNEANPASEVPAPTEGDAQEAVVTEDTVVTEQVEAATETFAAGAATNSQVGGPAYYKAPEYAAPGSVLPAPPKALPPLNPVITLMTLGSILVIMALALGLAILSGYQGGRIMTSAAGLCILIVAAVLAYIALRGLSAKWFLVASAIGAFALGPVVIAAAGAANWSYVAEPTYYEEVVVDSYSSSPAISIESVEDDLFVSGLNPGEDPVATYYDWTQFVVATNSGRVVLDLTGAPSSYIGQPLDYSITATSGAEVVVLARPDQIPVVWPAEDPTDSRIYATVWEEPGQKVRMQAAGWAWGDNPYAMIQEFWGEGTGTQWSGSGSGMVWSGDGEPYYGDGVFTELSLNVQTQDSVIYVVQVADPSVREPVATVLAESVAEEPQSAEQSDLELAEQRMQQAEAELAAAREAAGIPDDKLTELERAQQELADAQAKLAELEKGEGR